MPKSLESFHIVSTILLTLQNKKGKLRTHTFRLARFSHLVLNVISFKFLLVIPQNYVGRTLEAAKLSHGIIP